MKIAFVTGRYHPFTGGIETHVREIAAQLAKSGQRWEIEVVTTDPIGNLAKEDVVDRVVVRRFKSTVWRDAYYFSPSLEKYLRKNIGSYKVMHAHGYHSLVPLHAARAAKNSNHAPVFFFTPHYLGSGGSLARGFFHYPYRFVSRKIFSTSRRIISLSRYERDMIMNHFGVRSSKISIIPNGVDLSRIRGLKKSNKGYKVILSVCRLVKYKGLRVLLEAFSRLADNFHLEIVGEGPFMGDLLRKVSDLGLRERVHFYQRLPRRQLLQKFVDSDLFVLASEHEALPISLLEALAARIPCIVSNIPPLKEWIDGRSCFGIDFPVDANKLASLMQTVIDTPVQPQKILGWDEVAERLQTTYLKELERS